MISRRYFSRSPACPPSFALAMLAALCFGLAGPAPCAMVGVGGAKRVEQVICSASGARIAPPTGETAPAVGGGNCAHCHGCRAAVAAPAAPVASARRTAEPGGAGDYMFEMADFAVLHQPRGPPGLS